MPIDLFSELNFCLGFGKKTEHILRCTVWLYGNSHWCAKQIQLEKMLFFTHNLDFMVTSGYFSMHLQFVILLHHHQRDIFKFPSVYT